jgi:hypothetical protein
MTQGNCLYLYWVMKMCDNNRQFYTAGKFVKKAEAT